LEDCRRNNRPDHRRYCSSAFFRFNIEATYSERCELPGYK